MVLEPDRENAPTNRVNCLIFRFHPFGYNFYINRCPLPLWSSLAFDTWACTFFAMANSDYDDLLPWPPPKTIHLRVRDQLDSHNTLTHVTDPQETQELSGRPSSADFTTKTTIRCTCCISRSKNFIEVN